MKVWITNQHWTPNISNSCVHINVHLCIFRANMCTHFYKALFNTHCDKTSNQQLPNLCTKYPLIRMVILQHTKILFILDIMPTCIQLAVCMGHVGPDI